MSSTLMQRLGTVAAAGAVAAGTWAVTTQAAAVRLAVRLPHSGPSTLGAGRIIAVAAAAAAAGWLALAVAEKRVTRPRRTWLVVAAVVFLASLALPLGFALTTGAVLSLVAIHLAVAVVIVSGLAPTAPAHRLPTMPAGGAGLARPTA